MFRKTSGSILCPSCGRLTNADAAVCLVCGRRNPGMWGFAGPLRVLFRSWSFTNVVTAVCIVLFVATLVFDPYAALRPRGYFDVFAPSDRALWAFGAAGFVASNTFNVWFTVGASGSIFGLLGAIIAYARKRGGAFGRLVLQQYGQWALILFISGFLLAGVNNFAHAGGFVGGYAAGLGLSLAERRAESTLDWLLAAAVIAVTVVGFALALFTAFTR